MYFPAFTLSQSLCSVRYVSLVIAIEKCAELFHKKDFENKNGTNSTFV